MIYAMRILVDMDDVLADFNGEFLRIYRAKHPDRPYVRPEDRKLYKLTDDYPPELVKGIFLAPGFIKNLPPIKGGLEAVMEMEEKGHKVMICTAPLLESETCYDEKRE